MTSSSFGIMLGSSYMPRQHKCSIPFKSCLTGMEPPVLSSTVLPTTTTTPMVVSSTEERNLTAMIIGIALGCAAFLLLVFVIIGLIVRHCTRKGEMKVSLFSSHEIVLCFEICVFLLAFLYQIVSILSNVVKLYFKSH